MTPAIVRRCSLSSGNNGTPTPELPKNKCAQLDGCYLAALVRDKLALDPLSGQLFVFRSRRGDRVKLLFWDGDGYALWYKRLELGLFRFPTAAADAVSVKISAGDFRLLLDGVDLTSVRRGKRYRREA
jgi:transposase